MREEGSDKPKKDEASVMSLSTVQLAAILQAKKLLEDVGLTTRDSTNHRDADRDFLEVDNVISRALAPPSRTVVAGSRYTAPPARPFTAGELLQGLDYINRQTCVHALVEHPLGVIVEYPETGSSFGLAVAHRFTVDPNNFFDPLESFQYSLGDKRGGESDACCGLLVGPNGSAVNCVHKRISCKGLKYCSARSLSSLPLPPLHLDSLAEAKKEIFYKTLGLYCALAEKGCSFDVQEAAEQIGLTELTDEDPDLFESGSESESENGTKILKDRRRRDSARKLCKGKLVLQLDEYGRSFVQCQHRKSADRAHLILRSLDEFDIAYLRALLENDIQAIEEHEELARQFGYGPLAPCSFSAPPSAQKELCPHWHRHSGKLARGKLERHVGNCDAIFDAYRPHDLSKCPQVVVVCRNPHSHSDPEPVKTPPPLLKVLKSLLLDLDWKLADATPRKLMVDAGFMSNFRYVLGWNQPFDPPLSALHPSLGNLDHVRRYIDELRHVLFPEGTGFEGAQLLATEHSVLPEHEQYVRCAETHSIEGGKTFHLVICMLRSMSFRLMQSKKLSLDTAFKRLNGKWQEFEMETWELNHMKSIIGVRAFTTSQSAEAHLILFTRIFEIAHADTGIPCRFRHIHGEGFELWITDAHKGQALGAGMFCQKLCAQLGEVYCPMEPSRLLRSLDPYEQLKRFLRLCTVHHKRNIDAIRSYVTPKVYNAMLSISSSQIHPDLEGTFKIIENGGRKAKAWLNDKRTGSKFAIPALYQPLSLIPLEIWKSAPASTNGNEQAHRSINRDGVNLTMLGGIMRGMQYDARAMGALELHSSQGIYSRDQTSTHFRRLQRSLNRHVTVQTRVAARHDALENEQTLSVVPVQLPSPFVRLENDLVHAAHQLAPAILNAAENPLFTTAPLVPGNDSSNSSRSSWLDESMQVDSATQDSSARYSERQLSSTNGSWARLDFEAYYGHQPDPVIPYIPDATTRAFPWDSWDGYPAAHGHAMYAFNPAIFNMEVSDNDTSYLHVPQPYEPPPSAQFRAFADHNRAQ